MNDKLRPLWFLELVNWLIVNWLNKIIERFKEDSGNGDCSVEILDGQN